MGSEHEFALKPKLEKFILSAYSHVVALIVTCEGPHVSVACFVYTVCV